MAAPELRLIGSATGEVVEGSIEWLQARVVELEGHLEAAEKDLRSKRGQITHLLNKAEEDRKRKAKAPVVDRIFDAWREHSGHVRAKCGPKRFDAIYARLCEGYTEAELTMAVVGVAFDPFTRERKNGTVERFDDCELACRDEVNVERFANRCPAEVRRELSGRLFEA